MTLKNRFFEDDPFLFRAPQEAPQPVAPCAEQLHLTLEELQKYQGQDGGRILMSVGGAGIHLFFFGGGAIKMVKFFSLIDVPS